MSSNEQQHPAKRAKVEDDDSSSEDEGPMPLPAGSAAAAPAPIVPKKKRVLKFEKVHLQQLPLSDMYEKSFMHREVVTHTLVTRSTDFVVTASQDGHLKFWKKTRNGIEFVKNYKAHVKPFTSLCASSDGLWLCSTAVDQAVKIFDVVNFDMINMIKVGFIPGASAWVHKRGSARQLVALSDRASPNIFVYNTELAKDEPVHKIALHTNPVTVMTYCEKHHLVVSGDASGVIEYWNCDTFDAPTKPKVSFDYKMETDLFDVMNAKSAIHSIDIDREGKNFVVTSGDQFIRVFSFKTGKLRRKYDESLKRTAAMVEKGKSFGLDNIDLGRRMAVEREYTSTPGVPPSNAVFDESGNFIIYPTVLGIKVLNIVTNKLMKTLGKIESGDRFASISLYQGIPKHDHQLEHALKGSDKSAKSEKKTVTVDPTIICTAFKKPRFFLFTKREPDDSEHAEPRDVLNEKPSKQDLALQATLTKKQVLGQSAVIHTTLGDIEIKLFRDECPKTVENFTKHSQDGYYNGVIFHRVIKNFMIQTGDPKGDGTGGTSIWGKDFEDEFNAKLRHDREYTVSMANAGPCTNGSQFFITTVATPWLDNKHTVFGRVVRGSDTVNRIEAAGCDSTNKPHDDINIVNIDIKT